MRRKFFPQTNPPIMVEFIHHFETLVEERNGQIIDSSISQGTEYHYAIFPFTARIQKHDLLSAGISLQASPKRSKLSTFYLREISQNGFIRPRGIFQQTFQSYQLEHFVIELFSQIDLLKFQHLKESAGKFIEAKSGSNPLTLRIIARWVDDIIERSDTLQVLSHYMAEEDQRGLNPLGIFGKRVRYAKIVDRFDAANAVSALARDMSNPQKRWALQELAGRILWEENSLEEKDTAEVYMNKLYLDRRSYFRQGN